MELLLVVILAADEAQAQQITDALLEARLVGCVNRISGIDSQYWWQGVRERDREVMLTAKTRRDLWPRVLEAVKAHHTYDVVSAYAVPVLEVNPDYLEWLRETTEPAVP